VYFCIIWFNELLWIIQCLFIPFHPVLILFPITGIWVLIISQVKYHKIWWIWIFSSSCMILIASQYLFLRSRNQLFANASKFVQSRFLGNNSLSGSLPRSIGPSVANLYVIVAQFYFWNKSGMIFIYISVTFPLSLSSRDFSYNQLSGSFPSWATQKLQL